MLIELYARFPKKRVKTAEEKQQDEIQRLINPAFEESEDVVEAEYDFVCMHLDEVADFLRWDDTHTQIIKKNGILYIARIPYRQFKSMFSESDNEVIRKFYNPDIVNK